MVADRGLLLPRDQRLLLRDMSDGKEYVFKRAVADAYYANPRWSPDGKQVAYVQEVQYSGAPGQHWGSDIALSATDGSGERILLKRPQPGFQVQGIDWAPDGTALYAGISETTFKDGRFLGQTVQLERIDVATGARTTLVPEGTQPSVARDGSRIAYITFGAGDQPGGLWTARHNGADRKLLLALDAKFAVIATPRFSPDSQTIAFAAATFASGGEQQPSRGLAWRWPWQAREASAHGLPMDIWTMPAGGGEPRRLTTLLEDEPSPAWSPDGTQLAIVATGGLYQMPAAGGEPRKIGLGGTTVQIDWR